MSEAVGWVRPSISPRVWWGLVLVLDAFLLVFLPYIGWIAAGAGVVAAAIWVVREPHRALGFAALGTPMVSYFGYHAGLDPSVVLVEQIIVLVPLGLQLWSQLWQWPGGTERMSAETNSLERTSGRPSKATLFFWVGLLAFSLGFATMWTPSPVYGHSKFVLFVIRNGLFLIGAWTLLRPRSPHVSTGQRGEAFLRFLVVMSLVFALSALWSLWTFGPAKSRLAVMDLNPIWFARYVGVGILAVSSLLAMGRMSRLTGAALLLVLIPTFYLAGSRGPLLGILTAGCFFLLSGQTWNTPARRTLLIAVPALTVVVLAISIAQGALEQWSPFGSHSASNVARTMMLQVAFDWISRPGWFGLGTGAYSSVIGVGDIRFYPHNILVELWLENGVLGTLAFFGFCWTTAQVWRRSRRDDMRLGRVERELVRFAATWFVFSFVNAQFSGDLPANEHLFLSSGALLAWSSSREAKSVGSHPNRSVSDRPEDIE